MEPFYGRSLDCSRVLIADNLALMGAGLEKLLSAEKDLEVVGVAVQSEEELVQEIWRIGPDVLVLTSESQIVDLFHFWQQLENYGRLRIVLISLYSNTVQIFEMQQMTVFNFPADC